MFDTGDIINSKHVVTGECSSSGGMGTVVFVDEIGNKSSETLVLKYCKIVDDETKQRFRREVRFLNEILIKDKLRAVVPYHKSVKIGTLRAILNQIEMSLEDFQKLL